MPAVQPLAQRRDRYEAMKALRDAGKTYEEIAAVFHLTRERVRQVLNKAPRKPGPPFAPGRITDLIAQRDLWEKRRAERLTKGKNTTQADERIAAITARIDEVRAYEDA